MDTSLFLLIIALAVSVGCYVGQKHLIQLYKLSPRHSPVSRDYFIGLNYLINEEPDKAVDVFTRLLQVDTETIETHLALGSLFRRRGEVGRAIRIHQNLIARPQLSKTERVAAMIALGKDYLHAGLVDRAERVFLEIASLGEQPGISLYYLLEIYQQQKNWAAAIKVAEQLESLREKKEESLANSISHYYCEMAQQLMSKRDWEAALKNLKLALKSWPQAVRASLLQGEILTELREYKAAIEAYQKIDEQDKNFFAEALPGLMRCYKNLQQEKNLIEYLYARQSVLHDMDFILYITDYLRQTESDAKAIEFLTSYLQKHSSLTGLKHLIQLQLDSRKDQEINQDMMILQAIVQKLLHNKSRYRCSRCGFKSNVLLWLCPGCKTWSNIQPVHEA